jgi:hypothetical protein
VRSVQDRGPGRRDIAGGARGVGDRDRLWWARVNGGGHARVMGPGGVYGVAAIGKNGLSDESPPEI